jgi:hypothetical protein
MHPQPWLVPRVRPFFTRFSPHGWIAIQRMMGYSGGMNTLPEPVPGRLWVVSTPHSAIRLLLDLAARLALESSLRVLDCGNCFNVYTVTQVLHQRTSHTTAALRRISVARAFTCYQVTTLLESTPQDATPTLVLDLLGTFHDESVALGERQRLLDRNVAALRRLSRQGSVMVSIHPKGPAQEQAASGLLETLEEAADQVWRFEAQAPPPVLRLF